NNPARGAEPLVSPCGEGTIMSTPESQQSGMSPQHPTQAHTFNDLLDAYKREVLPSKAAVTQYNEQLFFQQWCQDLGPLPLAEITPARLRAWRDALATHYSAGSMRRHMAAMSRVFRFAVEELDWLDSNPMRKVRKPSEPMGRTRFLAEAER